MKVLSVASECVPFVKTGGLADVVGALPAALAAHGIDMRVMLPGYEPVIAALGKHRVVAKEDDLCGGPARLLAGKAEGLSLYVLEAPHLYDRAGSIYLDETGQDWADNPQRFAALSWTAAYVGRAGAARWKPNVLHCHDWQAGLAPIYHAQMGGSAATVMTIHNIAFAGLADASEMQALRLDSAGYTPDGFEFYGRISALKGGMIWADKVTTVSPTYAEELATPHFGMGLDGVIRARGADMSGILNGIDDRVWNPASDADIPATYSSPAGKAANREALIAEMGLDPEATGPLVVAVSRLTEQKGFDVLAEALPALLDRGGQFALLGSGSPEIEARFKALAAAHPRVGVEIGYNEALAHRLIAGGDAIAIPSRFEPCGLTQLYGLRYGTIPLVARTGGLADTVIDANHAARLMGVGTGFIVAPDSVDALKAGFGRMCTLWESQPAWENVVQAAMLHPVDWGPSAATYAALYAEISGKRAAAA